MDWRRRVGRGGGRVTRWDRFIHLDRVSLLQICLQIGAENKGIGTDYWRVPHVRGAHQLLPVSQRHRAADLPPGSWIMLTHSDLREDAGASRVPRWVLSALSCFFWPNGSLFYFYFFTFGVLPEERLWFNMSLWGGVWNEDKLEPNTRSGFGKAVTTFYYFFLVRPSSCLINIRAAVFLPHTQTSHCSFKEGALETFNLFYDLIFFP